MTAFNCLDFPKSFNLASSEELSVLLSVVFLCLCLLAPHRTCLWNCRFPVALLCPGAHLCFRLSLMDAAVLVSALSQVR